MAHLAARCAGSLLLMVAASRMVAAERVVVNVKDEQSKANNALDDTGTPVEIDVTAPGGVTDIARKFGGNVKSDQKDAEEIRAAELEDARIAAEKAKELEDARIAKEEEEARIAKEEELSKLKEHLQGTWVSTDPTYSNRWYRIGASDQDSFELPIAVMSGAPSSIVIGDTVKYTGEETNMAGKGTLLPGATGTVVDVMPKEGLSPMTKVLWGLSEVKWNVKISNVKVTKFEFAKAKVSGFFPEEVCSGECCQGRAPYNRKTLGKTLGNKLKKFSGVGLEVATSTESEAALWLNVKICIGDKSGEIKITEKRYKVAGDDVVDSKKTSYVKVETVFKKVVATQK